MRKSLLAISFVFLGFAAQSTSAEELFLLNIPGIAGDVTLKGYEGWISVTAFSAGFTNSDGRSFGGGADAGRTNCQELHVVKMLDVTSPEVAAAVATGHRYANVKLAVLKEGSRNFEFLRFSLSNVIFTSVTFGGSTNTSTTTDVTTTARVETLALKPAQISLQFVPQSADGTPGTPVSSMVDCATR
jgi:type VI secretion system secreted protein Hcp